MVDRLMTLNLKGVSPLAREVFDLEAGEAEGADGRS